MFMTQIWKRPHICAPNWLVLSNGGNILTDPNGLPWRFLIFASVSLRFQISYGRGDDLPTSDYHLRAGPFATDDSKALAIIELLQNYNWKYVSVVYSGDDMDIMNGRCIASTLVCSQFRKIPKTPDSDAFILRISKYCIWRVHIFNDNNNNDNNNKKTFIWRLLQKASERQIQDMIK